MLYVAQMPGKDKQEVRGAQCAAPAPLSQTCGENLWRVRSGILFRGKDPNRA